MSKQGFIPIEAPVRMIALEVDGRPVKVREGQTILDACKTAAVETPTLCFATNLTPVNACRVCVVELEGARVLVPACARKAEAGDMDAALMLARRLLETGKAEESVESFNSALGYNPDFDKARYNLGRAYMKLGNRDMAQVQYEILRNSRSDWADRLFVLLNP